MKKYTIYIYTLCVLFICGCGQSKKDYVIEDKDFNGLLRLEESKCIVKSILNVRDFIAIDSFLVVNNARKDSVIMVINLNNLNCIKSWGIKGNGPNELGVFTHLLKVDSNRFQFVDFSKNKINTYRISDFRNENEEKINFNNSKEAIREVPQNIFLKEGREYYYDSHINNELFLNKWINGSSPIVLRKIDKYDKRNKSIAYAGVLTIGEKSKKIIYAYRYMRRIDIMNLEGTLIKSINRKPEVALPKMGKGKFDIENSTLCYWDIRATNNSFYVYYIGHSGRDIYKNNFHVQCFIEEYDWDGNPINLYCFDRYISKFEIYQKQDKAVTFIGNLQDDNNPLIFYSLGKR
ncbi:MAG: TolB-like 6-bladed beta-propeller domain-containing protein [Prolixibacteraceae bacterium]|jgi:hypothetical protein|nr:TolB-like 6-bladed beta-propeller domain-containing protein [Prolixibacteraceae bacterium]